MHKFFSIVVLLFSIQAQAATSEVPSASVICTISSGCEGGYAYYQLRTTFQLVSEINVDAGTSACSVTTNQQITSQAHQKLLGIAQQLKEAGACNVIVDNLN